MQTISFHIIQDINEIEILRGKSSKQNNFVYLYDDATLELLKKNFILPDSFYLLAKLDNTFVGFCSLDRDWWGNNYFMLREIFIDPTFQRQGIGEIFFRKCIEHVHAKGALWIITETAHENTSMQKLCTKLGFYIWDNPQWKEGITYKLIF